MARMAKHPLSAQALGHAQADKRIEVLQLVGEQGSISQAARAARVSYKAAWQALHTLTNLAGEPLVDSSVGGSGGGGARLTPAGERLLQAARAMEAARREVLDRVNGGPALAAPRTSMRNALRARVRSLESSGPRDPMVSVRLVLDGGEPLSSLVTRESADLLGLAPGVPLLALCKATAVVISAAGQEDGVVALPGRVMGISRGHARDEVTLALHGEQRLIGFAARPNRLRAGSRALACLPDHAVVLALVG